MKNISIRIANYEVTLSSKYEEDRTFGDTIPVTMRINPGFGITNRAIAKALAAAIDTLADSLDQ